MSKCVRACIRVISPTHLVTPVLIGGWQVVLLLTVVQQLGVDVTHARQDEVETEAHVHVDFCMLALLFRLRHQENAALTYINNSS